uniref:Uncharacterized protein n=1 Tax=Arundo donax TaxID=35708 RepID=A0A0A9HA83_ARUDO
MLNKLLRQCGKIFLLTNFSHNDFASII